MEVKLSEEIQINLLKTFQWFFKACLDIRWFLRRFSDSILIISWHSESTPHAVTHIGGWCSYVLILVL